ncbi:MAG: hypothetical protein RLY71_424 [Pseudomonadota bacterium]
MLGYSLAQLRGYANAHARVDALRRLADMDAQRMAAHADAGAYREFREALQGPGAQRQRARQDEDEIDKALAAFGLVRE